MPPWSPSGARTAPLACAKFPFCSDRKSTRLNSSHLVISYAVFCLKKKKTSQRCHSITISAPCVICFFFFFNDTATTEIYTLSLHDALPIYGLRYDELHGKSLGEKRGTTLRTLGGHAALVAFWRSDCAPCLREIPLLLRSEEHTSELQSPCNLVCRLLLEKKKNITAMSFDYYLSTVRDLFFFFF